MPQDNTVGAPTEGLGQTVTFQADPGRVGQIQAPSRARLNNDIAVTGARGGGRGTQIPLGQPDVTLSLIQRMGGEVLKPMIERQRNESFAEGMRKASSNQAIAEIVDEQPWYSQVFGETPVVEGARAWASFATVQNEAAAIEGEMVNLRSKSPKEAQKFFGERLSSINTGDSLTDAITVKNLANEMPNIMKRHAKEHFGWQQEQLATAWSGAHTASVNNYTVLASKLAGRSLNPQDILDGVNTVDVTDVFEAGNRLTQSFKQPIGMPDETYRKIVGSSIGNLLVNNNLHAFNALDERGVIEGLGPEVSKKLREQADRSEVRIRANMPQPLVDEYAKIRAMPTASEEPGQLNKMRERITNFNSMFQAVTGSRTPAISGLDNAGLQTSLYGNILRDEEQARKAAESKAAKAQSETEKLVAFEQQVGVTVSQLRVGANVSDQPEKVVDAAWLSLRARPEEHRAALVQQLDQGLTDKVYEGQLRARVGAATRANDPATFDRLYESEFLPLLDAANGNMATALVYFGSGTGREYAQMMSTYHYHLGGKGGVASAKINAFTVATSDAGKPLTDGKPDGALQKATAKAVAGKWLVWGDGLNEDRVPGLSQLLNREVDKLGSIVPLEVRVEAALANKVRDGLEIVGGQYWMRPYGLPSFTAAAMSVIEDGRPVIAGDQKDRAIRKAIDSIGKESGLSGPYSVIQHPYSKEPLLLVSGLLPNGSPERVTLTPQQVAAYWKDKTKVTPEIRQHLGTSTGRDGPTLGNR